MDKLAVTGDQIVLQPVGFMWQGWDGKLPLQGSNIITSEGKSVILETDLMLAALKGVGKMYVAPPFATPGSVINLQLTVVPVTLSLAVSIQGQAVVTASTTGTYTAAVVPAMNPQGVPDPLVTKVGQWSIETTSQTSFRSGVPQVVQPASNSDSAGEGDAEDTNGTEHWVGVSVEDVEGQQLSNQVVSLEVLGGETLSRTLGDAGACRVDGIVLEMDEQKRTCIVRMAFDPRRVPVRSGPVGSIAVQLVDDDGTPFAGRDVVLTLPNGQELRRTLNEQGRARFTGVPEGAKCRLNIVPAQVLLEFTVVDENGAPLAGAAYSVTDCLGVAVDGLLDEQGFASVMVAEGECDVKVDADAAQDAVDADAEPALLSDEDNAHEDSAHIAPTTSDERHAVQLIEVTSALFRLESAVVMPEGEAPDEQEHLALSMTSIFAKVLRHADEHRAKTLFVAGHADTSGDSDSNVVLSAQRANLVLSVLTADRDTFSVLAEASHTVADYKQILSWCTSAFPQFFDCDPGPINDQEFSGVEPLRAFQTNYNDNQQALGAQGPTLDTDGSMGPQTWAAIFDVYQFALREELGEDADETARLQQSLEFVDRGRKALGFGETHPADGSGDHTRSQANRRVEILFFDPGEEPDLAAAESDPAGSDLYDRQKYEPVPIEMKSARRTPLLMQFFQESGQQFDSTAFRITAADGTSISGRAVDGLLTAKLPAETPSAELALGALRFELRFGVMRVVSAPSMQASNNADDEPNVVIAEQAPDSSFAALQVEFGKPNLVVVLEAGVLRLALYDEQRRAMPNTPYKVFFGSNVHAEGISDADALVRVAVGQQCPEQLVLRWGPLDSVPELQNEIFVECTRGDAARLTQVRLNNLGYPSGVSLPAALAQFQSDNNLAPEPLGPDNTLPNEAQRRLDEIFTTGSLDATHFSATDQPREKFFFPKVVMRPLHKPAAASGIFLPSLYKYTRLAHPDAGLTAPVRVICFELLKSINDPALEPWSYFRKCLRRELTFLGRPVQDGANLHSDLVGRLGLAENRLLALAQPLETLFQLGTRLGLREKAPGQGSAISGARETPTQAAVSLHFFGQAIDLDPDTQFSLEDEDHGINAVNKALAKARLLFAPTEAAADWKWRAETIDQVLSINAKVKDYFSLLQPSPAPDPAAPPVAPSKGLEQRVADLVAAHDGATGPAKQQFSIWKTVLDAAADKRIEAARKQISNDADLLVSQAQKADAAPAKAALLKVGLFGMDRQLIDGLNRHVGWGFKFGDLMHFDLREGPGDGSKILAAINRFKATIREDIAGNKAKLDRHTTELADASALLERRADRHRVLKSKVNAQAQLEAQDLDQAEVDVVEPTVAQRSAAPADGLAPELEQFRKHLEEATRSGGKADADLDAADAKFGEANAETDSRVAGRLRTEAKTKLRSAEQNITRERSAITGAKRSLDRAKSKHSALEGNNELFDKLKKLNDEWAAFVPSGVTVAPADKRAEMDALFKRNYPDPGPPP